VTSAEEEQQQGCMKSFFHGVWERLDLKSKTVEGARKNGKERHDMKTKAIAYWQPPHSSCSRFCRWSGGIGTSGRNVEGMVHLGYPLYFITIIGFWKVLGAIAWLAPVFRGSKNGRIPLFFNMTARLHLRRRRR